VTSRRYSNEASHQEASHQFEVDHRPLAACLILRASLFFFLTYATKLAAMKTAEKRFYDFGPFSIDKERSQ
jgi:hypothetical protein